MKNKVYVVVSVPMIDQEFDMYLPIVKKVGAIKKLIIRIVEEEMRRIQNTDEYISDKADNDHSGAKR